ncbi:hypothetical protein OIU77_014455 [Salix suchowensis]|uniref:Uncharacterized protein n=1 Tax=Salix suchowensis TaxID=1278906 RepID=A0ABQ8ZY74_9ROSI|nr:hypothetical protein OIU77_014455 [Salix suchowensis]
MNWSQNRKFMNPAKLPFPISHQNGPRQPSLCTAKNTSSLQYSNQPDLNRRYILKCSSYNYYAEAEELDMRSWGTLVLMLFRESNIWHPNATGIDFGKTSFKCKGFLRYGPDAMVEIPFLALSIQIPKHCSEECSPWNESSD